MNDQYGYCLRIRKCFRSNDDTNPLVNRSDPFAKNKDPSD